MSTTTINARIDEDSKIQAQHVLAKLGLSMSSAIEMFFRQIALHQGIPFEVKLPSQETQQAMDELEKGKGVRFDTVEDLFEDLNS